MTIDTALTIHVLSVKLFHRGAADEESAVRHAATQIAKRHVVAETVSVERAADARRCLVERRDVGRAVIVP